MSDPVPHDIAAALAATRAERDGFGAPVYYFSETSSTNDVAASLAERGAPQGTTVIAATQTAGRGRFGREWFSPPGAGLYVSVVVRDPAAAPYLTLAGGVAVADGVHDATALPVEIKWPNDVVVPAGSVSAKRRKLAGILAEASTAADGLQHVVLGFGVNLRPAAYPVEIVDRATSIETELGRPPDGPRVLGAILGRLAVLVAQLAAGDPAPLLARWRALAPTAHGAIVKWDTPAGVRSGVAAGIDDRGALLVHIGGRIERIIGGEVRWA